MIASLSYMATSELILLPSFPQRSTITKRALPPSKSNHERIGRSLPRRRRLRRGRGGVGAAGGFDGGVFGLVLAERARHACGWWRERGEDRRFVAGRRLGEGRGRRGAHIDQGLVELVGPRDDDLVADVQAVGVGDGLLVGRPEGLVIPFRLVVELRDRPEGLAAADRVDVRVLAGSACPIRESTTNRRRGLDRCLRWRTVAPLWYRSRPFSRP